MPEYKQDQHSDQPDTQAPPTAHGSAHGSAQGSAQTNGEYLVGLGFNPGGNPHVSYVKLAVANLIDFIEREGKDGRCTSIAVHQLEDAAMWAVKSLTKPPR